MVAMLPAPRCGKRAAAIRVGFLQVLAFKISHNPHIRKFANNKVNPAHVKWHNDFHITRKEMLK